MMSLSFTRFRMLPLSQSTEKRDKKLRMPKETDAQRGARELMREAVAYYALARYDAMLAACELALNEERTSARAHHTKALALIGLGRFEEAVSSLNRALRLAGSAPSYYHAWLCAEKARALCELGRESEALSAYHQASKLSPNDRTIQAEKEALLTRLIIGEEKSQDG